MPKFATPLVALLCGCTVARSARLIEVADNAGKEKVMKKIVTKSGFLVAAGLAILAMAVPVYAHTALMRMDIPFSFLAGEQRMPAGIYWVRFDGNFHSLDLTLANERKTYRVGIKDSLAMRKSLVADRGLLLFRNCGSTLVLAGVFAPGATERHDLRVSHAERELARATAPETAGETPVEMQNR